MRQHTAVLKYLLFVCVGFFLGIASTSLLTCPFPDSTSEKQSRQVHVPRSEDGLDAPGLHPASSSDCVCGVTADRLKRLAKLALYVGTLNSSTGSTSRCEYQLPTASPEDARNMRDFLYPSRKNPVLDYKKASRILYKYQPKTLNEEYVFKKQLFVAVLTQQEYLHTRAKYLYDTWGKDIDKLIFFVGEDCNITANISYLPIVKLTGIPDHVYPPLKKTFAVMKYMYQHYTNEFNWFMRADDDMYMRVDKLKALLSQIHPYDRVFMGRAGTGRKDDLRRLLLLPHERYCMGGPGIVMSMTTLREVGPHLSNCLDAVLHYSKSSYNDDDVELGRCLSRKINIQCSSSAQSRTYFFTDYQGLSLNPVTLWTTPSFHDVISIHPVKDPNHMQAIHFFYQSLKLQKNYEEIHEKIKYLNDLCHELPAYAAPPLSVSAGCNLKFHPDFKISTKIPSLLSGTLVVHKNSVPFFLRPRERFDVFPWTRFNSSLVQEAYGITPERSPSTGMQAELSHVLKRLHNYIESQYSSSVVSISRILDGYMRFNPHLGREYILTLKLELSNEPKPVYRKYHMIRELSPILSIVNKPITSSSGVVNVILPLQKVGSSFTHFLLTYSHVGLQYEENRLHLVIVVFSQELADEVESHLRTFTSKTFPTSVSIVKLVDVYDYPKAIQAGMDSLQKSISLVFTADVNLRFGPGFFRRCRLNTELGRQVFYPVEFQLYDLNFKAYSNGAVPPISAEVGKWDQQYFNHLCIYKRDFYAVGGYENRQHSLQLFQAISKSHLNVMQAPEPGLFRTWTTKKCRDLKKQGDMKTCLDMKRAGLFEQPERASYLGELKSVKNKML